LRINGIGTRIAVRLIMINGVIPAAVKPLSSCCLNLTKLWTVIPIKRKLESPGIKFRLDRQDVRPQADLLRTTPFPEIRGK
jgi:hypothetical protein